MNKLHHAQRPCSAIQLRWWCLMHLPWPPALWFSIPGKCRGLTRRSNMARLVTRCFSTISYRILQAWKKDPIVVLSQGTTLTMCHIDDTICKVNCCRRHLLAGASGSCALPKTPNSVTKSPVLARCGIRILQSTAPEFFPVFVAVVNCAANVACFVSHRNASTISQRDVAHCTVVHLILTSDVKWPLFCVSTCTGGSHSNMTGWLGNASNIYARYNDKR